jgi:steroid 5-alpha reductase family enzyme
MATTILLGWAAMAVVMGAAWARQRTTRDATAVDVLWSLGIGALVLSYAIAGAGLGDPTRRALVALVCGAWSLRLGGHLLRDRVGTSAGEDGRYRHLRKVWGDGAQPRFFVLYQVQAALAALFSLPPLVAMRGGPVDGWAWAGTALAALAIAGEGLADRQLGFFRRDPAHRGRTCRAGLWRYSRHPNYFFEWLHWWSYVLIAHGAALTWLGPALMLLFLYRVTGIPHTEAQALASRGDDYRDYQRTTSAFVPWPPRG